jgi:hypothetical protein
VSVLVLSWVAMVAIADLQLRSRGWDAYTERAVVERTARLGGTYYTTGSDQKGPFWLASYSAIWHLTTRTTFWVGIAVGIVTVAAITAWCAARILEVLGVGRVVAAAGAGAVFTYLVLGPEEFASVLYSRNLVSMVEVAAIVVLIRTCDRDWSRRTLLRLATVGGLAGLAIQTMPASGPFVFVLCGYAWSLVAIGRLRSPMRRGIPTAVLTIFSCAALVVIGVPIWYAARGSLHSFWQQWWTYNQTYNAATDRSPLELIRLGFNNFTRYYRQHALLAVGVVTGIIASARRWAGMSSMTRVTSVFVVVWWLQECSAVALAQRFFPHYMILPFVPAAIFAIAALGRVALPPRAVMTRHSLALPLAVVATVALFGADRASAGWDTIRNFRGLGDLDTKNIERLSPDRQLNRALVQHFTDPGEFIVIWSRLPWYYADVDRTSSSRWIENRWLTGEVFGGSTSPRWILPGSWEAWSRDIARTPPSAVLTFSDEPVPRGSPLAQLVSSYTEVYRDKDRSLFVTAERAKQRLGAVGPLFPADVSIGSGSGWTAELPFRWRPRPRDVPGTDVAVISQPWQCFQLEVDLTGASDTGLPAIAFGPRPAGGRYNAFTFRSHDITSELSRSGSFNALTTQPSASGATHRAVVIAGPRTAVLLDGDVVVGAVPRSQSWVTWIRPWTEPLELGRLMVAPRPDLC